MNLSVSIHRRLLAAILALSIVLPSYAAEYFEIAERLVSEEYAELRQQWLDANTFEPEQIIVIKAIQAFYNNDVEQAESLIEPVLNSAQNPETMYWAGRIYGRLASEASMFSAGSLAEKALDNFKRSVSMEPSFVHGQQALVQYYIRAPFFAGGSTEKALETATVLDAISPLEGALARLNIALSEEDDDQIQNQLAALETILSNEQAHTLDSLSGNYFRLALQYMQLENYEAAQVALNTSMRYNDDAITESPATTPEQQLNHQERLHARQAILYQTGRLGVFSETNIKASITALESFLQGPKHPNYEHHWGQLRYAQLLFIDGQTHAAIDIIEQLPEVDNENFEKTLKQLRKRIRKQSS
ncbi:MAG: tetratricopeptide repeat protein [Alteromonas sp.]